jgi:hypothetical protein
MLSGRYFHHVAIKSDENTEAWLCKYPTLVLYSKDEDHTPLAAVQFKTAEDDPRGVEGDEDKTKQLKKEKGRTVLMARPESEHGGFHGVVDVPNENLAFVITNLVHDGYLNINLMKKPKNCDAKDPGPGESLNRVNEIKPNQSYEADSDQANDCMMKLVTTTSKQTIKKAEAKPKAERDVEQDETFRIWLSVVAQHDTPTLVKKFSCGTEWKLCDVIVRHKPPVVLWRGRGANHPDDRGNIVRYQGLPASESEEDEEEKQELLPIAACGSSFSMRGPDNTIFSSSGVPTHVAKTKGPVRLQASTTAKKAKGQKRRQVDEAQVDEEFIKNTKVAKVVAGSVRVRPSGKTTIEYEYKTPSALVSIGFSLMDELVFVDTSKLEWSAIARERLPDIEKAIVAYSQHKYTSFLQKYQDKYMSDECVICQEDESPPNTRFFTCGHAVAHTHCAQTMLTTYRTALCPMCRASILAYLPLITKSGV